MAQQVIKATPPGLVRVAAYINALDELQLSRARVLHVDVDVEDEIAHFLHGAPRGPLRPGFSGPVALAAIAVADLWSGRDFPAQVGRDWDDLETAGGVQPLLE